MKIIDRKEFLRLPSGILFSEYEPCAFYGLRIKHDSVGSNDYIEESLIGNIYCDSSNDFVDKLDFAKKNKTSLKLDFLENGSRNGCYENNQLYAVYEKQDLVDLIDTLKQCVPYE